MRGSRRDLEDVDNRSRRRGRGGEEDSNFWHQCRMRDKDMYDSNRELVEAVNQDRTGIGGITVVGATHGGGATTAIDVHDNPTTINITFNITISGNNEETKNALDLIARYTQVKEDLKKAVSGL